MTEHQVAVIVFYSDDGTLLMHKRSEYKGAWLFVGGSIEEGELPEAAAKREVKEELGFSVQSLEFLGNYASSFITQHGSAHVFLAPFPGFEQVSPTAEGDVRNDLRLVTVDEARKLKTIPVVYDILNDVEVFLKNNHNNHATT